MTHVYPTIDKQILTVTYRNTYRCVYIHWLVTQYTLPPLNMAFQGQEQSSAQGTSHKRVSQPLMPEEAALSPREAVCLLE